MGQLNATGKQLVASSGRSQYDTEAINLLKDKQYLAWILKECTTEFAGMELAEIMSCIETPQVGDVPVEPGLTNTTIAGDATDSKVIGEGIITYDIRFVAILPKEKRGSRKSVEIQLHVDVEVQLKEKPGYSLLSRGILYAGRMLSEQMGRNVTGKNYDALQKVYSIWICMGSTLSRANTISRYTVKHDFVCGSYPNPEETDLLHLVVVRLPKENLKGKPKNQPTEFMKLLSALLSGEMEKEDRIKVLKEHGIVITEDMEERVGIMCNLSEGLIEKGEEIGKKIGEKRGEKNGRIKTLISLVQKNYISVQTAAEEAGMTEKEFEEMLTVTE